MADSTHWVWVFGEIEGLRWVLTHEQMAFRAAARRALQIRPGDLAVLHVSRGAFHNPTRDMSRLAGIVEVASPVESVASVTIAGREFGLVCRIRPLVILPERQGPEIRPLMEHLSLVKRPEVWGHYFRNSPLPISNADFRLLSRAIEDWQAEHPA